MTANEKLSLLAWLQPWSIPLPNPDGVLERGDLPHLIWGASVIRWNSSYTEIAEGAVAVVAPAALLAIPVGWWSEGYWALPLSWWDEPWWGRGWWAVMHEWWGGTEWVTRRSGRDV